MITTLNLGIHDFYLHPDAEVQFCA